VIAYRDGRLVAICDVGYEHVDVVWRSEPMLHVPVDRRWITVPDERHGDRHYCPRHGGHAQEVGA